ncbi:MAG: hypothetical protein CME65_00625 [Halobacteriovoraceae bacterium]|nr:hypothetical protein [Halobacteriovoraceae bacterium]|tara:strand:- start:10435 stop:11061 length:627 start_codon:yes stop_codon:yes gene_type:complete
MPLSSKIDFYFDFLSPFSFFAWTKLRSSPLISNIEPRAVPMGKLFSSHGFLGPGEIPAKRDYELKKCFRYAARNNIDFQPPRIFPFNPLAILRVATKYAAEGSQMEIIDLIFNAIWQKSMVLDDPELISELIEPQFEGTCERSFSRQARHEIRENIQSALDHGAFGVPSMVFQGELFWGNDEIPALLSFIDGNDNWNREYYDSLVEKK